MDNNDMDQNCEKQIGEMSFEEAFKKLEEIVKAIDSDQETLDSVVASFEMGMKLKEHCERKLKEAKLKVEKIVKHDNGEVITEGIEIS